MIPYNWKKQYKKNMLRDFCYKESKIIKKYHLMEIFTNYWPMTFETQYHNIYNQELVLIGDESRIYGERIVCQDGYAYFYKDSQKRIVYDYFKIGDLQVIRRLKAKPLFD